MLFMQLHFRPENILTREKNKKQTSLVHLAHSGRLGIKRNEYEVLAELS